MASSVGTAKIKVCTIDAEKLDPRPRIVSIIGNFSRKPLQQKLMLFYSIMALNACALPTGMYAS